MDCKRLAARMTAVLLLASALITPAFASTGTVATSAGTPLRMRSEASTEGSLLKKLPNGTQVEVLSSVDGGWYQVSYQGITGFVSAEYLTVDEDPDELSAETVETVETVEEEPVPAAAVPKEQQEDDGKSYVRVVEGPLNVRTGPGTGYGKNGKLYTGRVVEVLGLTNGWYQIDAGYISAEYVVPATVSEAQSSGKGQEIADYALQYLGTPYIYGGSSSRGFDCSGLTSYVYKQFGIKLNRTASGQLNNGYAVSRGELQPGDLVMFKSGGSKPASHVGVYIGNSQFVHASAPGVGVIISSLNESFYTRTYVGARRVI